eukprot:Amastigsp_a339828_62.p2 type:complete len:677 gc:universal Amastigsp_a339828_62:2048-18(-)
MGNQLSKLTVANESESLRSLLGENTVGQIVAGGSVVLAVLGILRLANKAARKQTPNILFDSSGKDKNEKPAKVAVDGVFASRMWKILKILIPHPLSPEAMYMLVVGLMMIARSYGDIWMLNNGTAIERCIITRDAIGFKTHLFQLVLAMLPLAFINNVLKYGLWELALRFRTRLTNNLYRQYLQGKTYYGVANLDSRVANPDQLLTQDVARFADSVADLYSNMSKPLLDIVIYASALTSNIGIQGPLGMLGYLVASGVLLTRLRRPTGLFTVQEQNLEGEFRFVNSRIITHSEEIAFYGGQKREAATLNLTFDRLVSHLRHAMVFRGYMGVVDNVIAKYIATVVGFFVMSRGFLTVAGKADSMDAATQSATMESYYRSGRMLVNLAKAMGRLVLAGRELTRLAGFTDRVTTLQTVLADLSRGQYKRMMVREGDAAQSGVKLVPNSGVIAYEDRVIRFEEVPIVTPNGDVLIPSMSFEVKHGMNVLVCGPNGCGKSSLFRMIAELWPLFGGRMTKPKGEGALFYIPQRPYLTLGSLRDQIIYPQTLEQFRKDGRSDDELVELLRAVSLEYVIDREGGFDTVQNWADVLSGGEKQRVAMARLFYNRPQFAILDECTSAVSVDVEGLLYSRCREEQITLFTVSHRKSLWQYHDYVLRFDGRGNYDFTPIDQSEADMHGS